MRYKSGHSTFSTESARKSDTITRPGNAEDIDDDLKTLVILKKHRAEAQAFPFILQQFVLRSAEK
jgi:hypothetical protein